jgi:hypothetical protein
MVNLANSVPERVKILIAIRVIARSLNQLLQRKKSPDTLFEANAKRLIVTWREGSAGNGPALTRAICHWASLLIHSSEQCCPARVLNTTDQAEGLCPGV